MKRKLCVRQPDCSHGRATAGQMCNSIKISYICTAVKDFQLGIFGNGARRDVAILPSDLADELGRFKLYARGVQTGLDADCALVA